MADTSVCLSVCLYGWLIVMVRFWQIFKLEAVELFPSHKDENTETGKTGQNRRNFCLFMWETEADEDDVILQEETENMAKSMNGLHRRPWLQFQGRVLLVSCCRLWQCTSVCACRAMVSDGKMDAIR